MKLIDIMEMKYDFPTTNKKITGLITNQSKLEYLGSGVQSIAFEHRKHPNSVIKLIQLEQGDIAKHFVRLCLNHQDNPFFPKIYKVKVYDKSDIKYKKISDFRIMIKQFYPDADIEFAVPDKLDISDSVMVLVMEKLHKMVDNDHLYTIANQLQQIGLIDDELFDTDLMTDDEEVIKKLTKLVKYAIRKLENSAIRSQLIRTSNNQKFVEALRLLSPILKNNIADFHAGNIMIRYTSVGPQLVFLDPVVS